MKSKLLLPISSANSYQTVLFRKFPFDSHFAEILPLILSPLCFYFSLEERAPKCQGKGYSHKISNLKEVVWKSYWVTLL